MTIYSIPPLLSAIIYLVFFVTGLIRARKSKVNLLMALICLVGFLLNTDIAILTIIDDAAAALTISRLDHLFLAFIIPLYLHFAVEVTNARQWMTMVKIFYGVAILLLPVSQHPLYLTGVTKYFFGYFANFGPLFYGFLVFSSVSFGLSLFLFIKSLRHERVVLRRTRVKYIVLSFGVSALISQLDLITMRGINLYPPGNFDFLPMCLLGYAVYRLDIMEWKVFLSKGLTFFTFCLFSLASFTGMTILVTYLLPGYFGREFSGPVALIATFSIVYIFFGRIQNFISRLLEEQFIKNRKAIRVLSSDILRLQSVPVIRRTIIDRLSALFHLDACRIEMVPFVAPDENMRFLSDSEPLWFEGFRISIPFHSRRHPAFLFLGDKGDGTLYTGEELELLSILANNVALAFDNSHAYSKLEQFSSNMENLVQERTKALIQSENLASVGRLAAGIAHELNNPLASVMSTIEYHLEKLPPSSPLRDDLEFSFSELRRTRDIVRSLLDSSRQKEDTKELVDVHKAIEDSIRVLRNEYKQRNITIAMGCMAEDSLIPGSLARLCQIFINIVRNSIDAIAPGGGMIEITTANIDLPPPPDSRFTTAGRHLRCTVRDNGSGMDGDVAGKVFQPFYTTKPQGKGMGLGLFIVHQITRDHGGSVTIASIPGEGTTVTLLFPCTPL